MAIERLLEFNLGVCDPAAVVSNTFTMEWPPKSGRVADVRPGFQLGHCSSRRYW